MWGKRSRGKTRRRRIVERFPEVLTNASGTTTVRLTRLAGFSLLTGDSFSRTVLGQMNKKTPKRSNNVQYKYVNYSINRKFYSRHTVVE